jgi:hypothetical protein
MDNARQRVNQTTVDIMRAARSQPAGMAAGMPGQYGMPMQQQQVMSCCLLCAVFRPAFRVWIFIERCFFFFFCRNISKLWYVSLLHFFPAFPFFAFPSLLAPARTRLCRSRAACCCCLCTPCRCRRVLLSAAAPTLEWMSVRTSSSCSTTWTSKRYVLVLVLVLVLLG